MSSKGLPKIEPNVVQDNSLQKISKMYPLLNKFHYDF